MNSRELAQALMAAFLEELQEHVESLNRHLLVLEGNPSPEERHESLKCLFRSAHTIKGAAAANNLTQVQAACHRLEDILSQIRDARRELMPDLFALLYRAVDALDEVGIRLREEQDLSESLLVTLLPQIERAANGESFEVPESSPRQDTAITTSPASPLSQTDVALEAPLQLAMVSPQPTSDLHFVTAQLVPSVTSASMTPPVEVTHSSEVPHPVVASASVRVAAEKLDALLAQCGELLVARRRVETRYSDVSELRDLASEWSASWRLVEKPLRKLLRKSELRRTGGRCDNGRESTPTYELPGLGQVLPDRVLSVLQQTGDRIRQFEKSLDRLAMRIREDGRQLGQSCDALDDEVYRARMLPFAEACAGLDRAVRDVSHSTGKNVKLLIEGADIEVDRSVLQALKAPLLHLVRNAVDHGIEPIDERRQVRKSETAFIVVAAVLRGAFIEVTVSDDGAGLNVDRIREVATQRGWHVPSEEKELVRLLFHPGFSTARSVTTVSGRGVGLDIVQSEIEGVHGTVDVSFTRGEGTQFTLSVPLTLTTIRALLVSVQNIVYAIPTTVVQQIVRFSADDLTTIAGKTCLRTKSEPIPSLPLCEALGFSVNFADTRTKSPGQLKQKQLGIILNSGSQSVHFVIDDVLAEQDIVVKSLGQRVRRLRRVSGATLLPTGQIALLLNVPQLLRSAHGQLATQQVKPLAEVTVLRRKRLLVVDDSLTTRTLVKTILESADYEIVTAVDGQQAFEMLPQLNVDLVVSDVDMPRMNGIELTSAIRSSQRFANLPVVLVTARDSESDKTRGLEVGANGYVTKTAFDQGTLLDVISRWV